MVKCPPGNQKVGGSNPTTVTLVGKTKSGHWDSPLHRRCPNGPTGPEWEDQLIKAELVMDKKWIKKETYGSSRNGT